MQPVMLFVWHYDKPGKETGLHLVFIYVTMVKIMLQDQDHLY